MYLIVELDFFWLQPGYFEVRYGTHWPDTAVRMLRSGADRVTLPLDMPTERSSEVKAMLKAYTLPADVSMQPATHSALYEATVPVEAELIAKFDRGDLATHMERLHKSTPFISFSRNV